MCVKVACNLASLKGGGGEVTVRGRGDTAGPAAKQLTGSELRSLAVKRRTLIIRTRSNSFTYLPKRESYQ